MVPVQPLPGGVEADLPVPDRVPGRLERRGPVPPAAPPLCFEPRGERRRRPVGPEARHPAFGRLEGAPRGGLRGCPARLDFPDQVLPQGEDVAGGRRGSAGAEVRRAVEEGPVRLVADRAHERHRTGGGRAHHEFVAEGKEVFHRTAAPGHHDDVEPLAAERPDPGGERPRRLGPLHRGVVFADRDGGEPSAGRPREVDRRVAAGGGQEADPERKEGGERASAPDRTAPRVRVAPPVPGAPAAARRSRPSRGAGPGTGRGSCRHRCAAGRRRGSGLPVRERTRSPGRRWPRPWPRGPPSPRGRSGRGGRSAAGPPGRVPLRSRSSAGTRPPVPPGCGR